MTLAEIINAGDSDHVESTHVRKALLEVTHLPRAIDRLMALEVLKTHSARMQRSVHREVLSAWAVAFGEAIAEGVDEAIRNVSGRVFQFLSANLGPGTETLRVLPLKRIVRRRRKPARP